MSLRAAVMLAMALSFSGYAFCDPAKSLDVPAGDLATALDSLAKQAGIELMYSSEQLKGLHTEGVRGTLTAEDAVTKLLEGTKLKLTVHESGALWISDGSGGRTTVLRETSGGERRLAEAEGTPSAPAAQEVTQGQKTPETPGDLQGVTLEEIVVTAQKRIERAQDVPVPLTALSGESLTNSNQLRVQDYYAKVPGLSLTVAGNGNEPVVSIRGITAGAESNPNVGIVVDEVPYGASVVTGSGLSFAPDIDPGDLARVEVLRGPQGTLYGAASMGGLLKFVTVDPSTDRLSGRLQVGGTSVSRSSDVGYSVRGSVNVPVNNNFAVRLSGFTLSDPGYVDNLETGRDDVNNRDSDGGRLSALWRPSESFSLKLGALYQDSKRGGTDDVDTALGKDPQQAFLRGTGIYDRETQAYSATMTGKLGQVEWVSATGYSIDDTFDKIDNTLSFGGFLAGIGMFLNGPSFNRTWTSIDTEVKKFTQEVRATLPIGERVSWLVGVFYTHEDTHFVNDVLSTNSAVTPEIPLVTFVNAPAKFEERATFTNFTFDLNDRWDVQVGGRYGNYKQHYESFSTGPVAAAFICGTPPCFSDPFVANGNAFTYLVTPRFKISDDLMVYARVASGYRPGGANVACPLDATIPCNFDPDTTRNYDLGVKGGVGNGRLSFDAALYYIDWQDMQVDGIVAPSANTYVDNVGGAKSQGVELAVESRPLRGMNLSAWVTYNDARLTAAFPSAGQTFGRSGDRLPFSSRLSGHVSLDQEFALWSQATGFVGGAWTYVGDRKGAFQDSAVRETYPAYTTLDLSGGVRYDTWTVRAFINNVTDKRGRLRGGLDSGAPEMASSFAYIQPRTIGLSLLKTFGR